MEKTIDLTQGNISKQLFKLALPLIATNFIQTSYSLMDMIWIGRLGSEAVIAVGTAGFFIHLAIALFSIIVLGTNIKIAQSFGAKDTSKMQHYILNAYSMAVVMAIVYAAVTIGFRREIIEFFELQNPVIEAMAIKYLVIASVGTIFMFVNALYSGIVNSLGNSAWSFKINTIGFLVNMCLDPVLIFGIGGHFAYGIAGAAYATIIGRLVVFALSLRSTKILLAKAQVRYHVSMKLLKEVVKVGLPIGIQRVSFTFFGIILARIIANFGATGIGVQKIGLQVEAVSFMTMAGLYGAMAAFIGQNYGAGKIGRIVSGYKRAMIFALIFGVMTMSGMLIFSEGIFKLFVKDRDIINGGISYLRIVGLSQVFMCMEIGTMGSFNGLGKTYVPAGVSLFFTSLRIPIAFILSVSYGMGIEGVWWTITTTSMIKGCILVSLFIIGLKKLSK